MPPLAIGYVVLSTALIYILSKQNKSKNKVATVSQSVMKPTKTDLSIDQMKLLNGAIR